MPDKRKRCVAPKKGSFAIATITRNPHRFDRWIDYYRKLGAAQLFIAVERTPEAVEMCKAHADLVTLGKPAAQQRNPYDSLIDRQEAHVNWAVEACKAAGIDWLFHVDDDELIHFGAPWEEIVSQVPDHVASDFTSISRFMVDDDHYLAYINGKAAGRAVNAVALGPHRFTGEEWEVPLELACVLHFESCPFSRWHDKFVHYASLTTRLSTIPFTFYVDSIKFFRDHRKFGDAALKAFWRKRKQWHYHAHPEGIREIRHLGLAEESERVSTRARRRAGP